MRIIRTSKEELLVELAKQEKLLLIKILGLYPLVPPCYQQLSRTSATKDMEDHQRMLDEALAEQRAENKKRLRQFLHHPKTFEEHSKGYRIHLRQTEMEWLLQILNDIRVGSWIALGSPEEKPSGLNPKTAPQFWAMEIAGFLQASLLNAWESDAEI